MRTTSMKTIKSQMASAGCPVLIRDIKKVETIWESDWLGGIPHVVDKYVYLKDGSVYSLTSLTVNKDGFYDIHSGRYDYSARFIAKEVQ